MAITAQLSRFHFSHLQLRKKRTVSRPRDKILFPVPVADKVWSLVVSRRTKIEIKLVVVHKENTVGTELLKLRPCFSGSGNLLLCHGVLLHPVKLLKGPFPSPGL